jgi:glycosyltransferase involved in cell wall biosynthesis
MERAGFSVVRTYTPPTDDLVELASDWGLHLLVDVFFPDWRYLVGTSRRDRRRVVRDARAAVRSTARRLAGAETLLGLSLGNEIPADVVRWVGARAIADVIEELADVVREEDEHQLVTYANYPSAEYLRVDELDFVTFNVFLERRKDFRRYLARLGNLAGDRPLVVGEMGLHAATAADEVRQAETIDWLIETALEGGAAGTCLFSWTDEWWVGDTAVDGWHFGLTRADRSPRAALAVAEGWNRRTVADVRDRWPSMSVVICAYNAAATLDECLRHTCSLAYPNLEILVVDDGSTDATGEIVADHPRARLVTIEHAGLSVARNEGYRAAGGEIVAYLDSDAYPTPEWPYYLALAMEDASVAGAGGPNVPPPDDPEGAQRVARAPGGPVHVLIADERAEHLPGCNMAFRREALEQLGGFDPVYTAAGDDVDLCWRVLDRGWNIGFHPAALVWHHRRSGARAYLRQQRGYGRAEALVEARHPDRFTGLGTARWTGRMYNPAVPLRGRQRIYRGLYGAAAFQSVYRGGGHVLDVAHQVGVPVAIAVLLSAPVALLYPLLGIPALAAAFALLALAVVDAGQVHPPRGTAPRLRFRVGVAGLCVMQPLVRSWGRLRDGGFARRDLPPQPALPDLVRRASDGVSVLANDRPRAETAAGIVDALRRARLRVLPATGWEDHDGEVIASSLVLGELVTSGHPVGYVQVRVRRRLRPVRFAAAVVVSVTLTFVTPAAGLVVAGIACLELARGMWRSGPMIHRVIAASAGGSA